MQEPELNRQSEFMIEKIKERPVNKKKLARRTIITAAMAVVFGLIACLTFLILNPLISKFLYPEESPQIVVFPEDQEEMSPEEMLADNMQQENQVGQSFGSDNFTELTRTQIEELMSDITLGKENYQQLYVAASNYVDEIDNSMVTVTGVTSDVDWLNNEDEKKHQSFGVIFGENGKELLMLADYTPLSDAERITVTFYNNVRMDAWIKGVEKTTNLAVLAVDLGKLGREMPLESVTIAKMGSSGARSMVGVPVVALGNPMGVEGSVGYGMITAETKQRNVADTYHKILQTDIQGIRKAGGVLFNFSGQVIGIITNNKAELEMTDMIAAYGITDLKKRLENICNDRKTPYLGICGVDVTRQANEEMDVPYGAYIVEVEMNSPSMLAGIQQGDILVSIDSRDVGSYSEFVGVLTQMNAGQSVVITVMRQTQDQYKEMTFNVVLGEM